MEFSKLSPSNQTWPFGTWNKYLKNIFGGFKMLKKQKSGKKIKGPYFLNTIITPLTPNWSLQLSHNWLAKGVFSSRGSYGMSKLTAHISAICLQNNSLYCWYNRTLWWNGCRMCQGGYSKNHLILEELLPFFKWV